MEQNAGVGKYIFRFGLVHLAILVGLSIVFTILEIESNSGVTIAALIGAAAAAVSKFIQDNKRAPNSSEKTKLVWLSYLVSWVVSLALAGIFFYLSNEGGQLIEAMKSIDLAIIIGIVALVSVFYLGALSLAYGYMARKQFDGMQKKGKI
ncbi:MAG: ABZJ_00895 family protein [Sedimenticola sp.]